MNARLPVLAAVLLALPLSACGSHPAAKAPPEVPTLKARWTAYAVPTGKGLWRTDEAIVTLGEDGKMAALNPATGDVEWRLRLPGEPCTTAEAPSASGELALVLPVPGQPVACRRVVLVDVWEGRVRWSRTVVDPGGPDYAPADFDAVSAGERVVAATDSVLGGLMRLDVRNGTVLPTLGREETIRATSDGRHVFTLTPHFGDDNEITVRDQDTGRRLGTFPAGDSFELHPVLANLPVLGAERGQGGTLLFAGRAGRPVARGIPDYAVGSGDRLYTVYGDVLVSSDARTGAEQDVAQLPPTDTVLGVGDQDLITVGPVSDGSDDPDPVLRRVDLGNPDDAQVLGRVPGGDLLADGSAVVVGNDRITAYRVPASGPPEADFLDALAWSPDDLRPDDVLDGCLAVSDSTRTSLGIAADGPVTGSCAWGGGEQLTVDVTAMTPGPGRSASERAAAEVEDADDAARAIDVGDGGWMSTSILRATYRFRNVVVVVSATGWNVSEQKARATIRRAAVDVADELARRAEDRS